jgi:hypothetical protein
MMKALRTFRNVGNCKIRRTHHRRRHYCVITEVVKNIQGGPKVGVHYSVYYILYTVYLLLAHLVLWEFNENPAKSNKQF